MDHLSGKIWENPGILGINKRAAHVQLRSFTSLNQISEHYQLKSERFTSPRQISLNGDDWKFKLHSNPEAVDQTFHDDGFDDNQWDTVGLARFRSRCTAAR